MQRKDEISKIADELLIIPEDLAPLFIEPDVQPFNPADDDGEEEEHFRVPSFEYLESFVRSKKNKKEDGRRQLFILADAGMGKTSLLAMLKLSHANSFWPKGYFCVAMKLGPKTLERLKSVGKRGKTLLLLDALDEDKDSFIHVASRIEAILKETQNFLRVIITCRTQFFPKTQDPVFQRQDRVRIGGFTCPVKYLSLFSDSQVNEYLSRKLPASEVKKAFDVVNHMGDLRCRPMLLSYIDDLIDERDLSDSYRIYSAMVSTWLDRECRKKLEDVVLKRENLLKACQHLARFMTHAGIREVSIERLRNLIKDFPGLASVRVVDIGGRSLLNRNSDGAYRFAHQSFQEFLTVQTLEANMGWDFPDCSDMMGKFMRSANLRNVNLARAKVSHANLAGAQLSNSSLTCAILNDTVLSGSNLNSSDLSEAMLKHADLSGCNLRNSDLGNANLNQASLVEADLRNADLTGADLSGAVLTRANLKNAILNRANLTFADFEGADVSNADLREAELGETSFVNANFSGVKINGAKLYLVDLKDATMNKEPIGIPSSIKGKTVAIKNPSEKVLPWVKKLNL